MLSVLQAMEGANASAESTRCTSAPAAAGPGPSGIRQDWRRVDIASGRIPHQTEDSAKRTQRCRALHYWSASSIETLIDAAERVETVRPDGNGIQEVVGDKGYHSNQSLVDLEAVGIRSYIAEPDRGRRSWKKHRDAREAVYRNRRIRGARGQRLLRFRGECLERPFAHLYETGGMRRVHLRGHTNILKRLLIHAPVLASRLKQASEMLAGRFHGWQPDGDATPEADDIAAVETDGRIH